jgi:hypothetical protein
MSQHDEPGEPERISGEASEQDSPSAASESKETQGVAPLRATEIPPEAVAGNLTVETLNRYLAVAAEDREAAEERSAEVIARFTKLTIAMMCVTMVIAGANVAMIIRQSTVTQPAAVVVPQPVQAPIVTAPPVQPVLPAPVPPESRELPRPAEKIPLLGSPPSTRASARQAPAPTPRLARTAPPRPQPLLSAGNVDNSSRESGTAERW